MSMIQLFLSFGKNMNLLRREAEEKAPEIPDVPKAQRRLSELKQKIRALGSVNVSAIDEYKEVSERYEFLKTQIGDVETSKAELLKLIDELTHQMQDIFVERFALINENFKQTFLELFWRRKRRAFSHRPRQCSYNGN